MRQWNRCTRVRVRYVMRVAIVTTSYPRSEQDPSGHFVRAEARALVRAKHDVVVIAPDGLSQGDGVDVIGARGFGAFGWPGVASRLRARPHLALGAIHWMSRARDALRHAGPFERVIAHWAVPSAWPVSSVTRGELEVVSHGADVRLLIAMPRALRERIVEDIILRATTWRFVSRALERTLTSCLPSRLEDRVLDMSTIEACAFELPDVRARAAELRANLAAPVMCSVSRLVATKRVDLVIRHAARAKMALVVIGGGPERARLELLAKEQGVDARFMDTLPRNEALAWIAASEAVVFASEAEGCSTVVREAEALGVRVERVA